MKTRVLTLLLVCFMGTVSVAGPGTARAEPSQCDETTSENLAEAMDVIPEFVRGRGLADVYAGSYMTHHCAGGLAHVGFIGNPKKYGAQLRNQFAEPARLRFFVAEHSYAELRQLVEQITDDIPQLEEQGVDVRTVGVSVPDNVVEVRVASRNESIRTLESRYGSDRLAVGEGPPVRYTEPGSSLLPMVIGLMIAFSFAVVWVLLRHRRTSMKPGKAATQ